MDRAWLGQSKEEAKCREEQNKQSSVRAVLKIPLLSCTIDEQSSHPCAWLQDESHWPQAPGCSKDNAVVHGRIPPGLQVPTPPSIHCAVHPHGLFL